MAGGGFPWWAGAGNEAVSLTEGAASGKASSASRHARHPLKDLLLSPWRGINLPLAPAPAGSGWQYPLAQFVSQGSPVGDPVQRKRGQTTH